MKPADEIRDDKLTVCVRDCGLTDFAQTLELQHELVEQRRKGQICDTVLITEHLPVITLGARQSANKLLIDRDNLAQKDIAVIDIRRGGGTTAHNPGQLVFYPILNLQTRKLGINEYIRTLESIGIELLEKLGVDSRRKKGFPGLWVGEKKIASIGVRVSKFITYHGMAINIFNDMGIFDFFVPCGLEGVEMTSVLKEAGNKHSMKKVIQILSGILEKHFAVSDIPQQPVNNKLPVWLKRPLPAGASYKKTERILQSLGLETICSSANCPNRGQCWQRGTATVLILGKVCTRNCKFCSVAAGKPESPDPTEPQRLAQMAKQMALKYLVITSVNRDDLPDGGAEQFRDCINETRRLCPDMQFEILTPDFRGCQQKAIEILSEALPFVFAHNVETVPSLYKTARGGGDYQLSLRLLDTVKKMYPHIQTKSSIMLGLGEKDEQVIQVLKDLRSAGCSRVTIGQYLKPSKDSLDVIEYITPEKFDYWSEKATSLGFEWVMSAPFARSSYFAEQQNGFIGHCR